MRIMSSVFDPHSSAAETAGVSRAFHRYALNYINALNYLETLRRHQEFCEFEKVKNEQYCQWALIQSWIILQKFCSGVTRIQGVTSFNSQISSSALFTISWRFLQRKPFMQQQIYSLKGPTLVERNWSQNSGSIGETYNQQNSQDERILSQYVIHLEFSTG